MNSIMGRVQLRDHNAEVPQLLVTVYDTKSTPRSSDGGEPRPDQADAEARWSRLGSVLTDEDGAFELAYDYADRDGDRVQRPDLALVLSAPEESCAPCREQHTRIATCVRHNAAPVESFLIMLDEAQVVAAGIRVLRDVDRVEELIAQRRSAAQIQERLRVEAQRFAMEKLEKRRERERLDKAGLDAFMAVLSAAPTERRDLVRSRYVPGGADIFSANQASIRSGIEQRINQAAIAGVVALTEEQAAQFRYANGDFATAIPAAALEAYLRPRNSGQGSTLTRRTAVLHLCHEGPVDPCVQVLQGEEPVEAVVDEEPTSQPGPTTHDIPLLIETLVKDMTSPESASVFEVQDRALVGDVQQAVDGFSLKSGPADVPSFHDFHHLQIAFEHVWQELFDDGLEATAKELYHRIVEAGGDPNKYLVKNVDELKTYLEAIKDEAEKVNVPLPPQKVIRAFEISPEQWDALAPEYSDALKGIAEKVLEAEKVIQDDVDTFKAGNEKWLLGRRERVRGWRRQGEHMIHYANQKVDASRNFEQHHDLLENLKKGMKEPYRFSVYAAGIGTRSVNFGLITTYRQKWEPLGYQVGELVKTIPLAPKEVRRFSKKVAIRKSRAEKEVENSLQVRKSESTETARAETEIVQKAQRKTNYQLSAEGGVNVAIANASGKSAFGQDAATESQEVKKEFREAVFKAAEEYKSERTVEINVSSSEEFTFEESGEISNPNDELPVTYLFYELQRRFRVSEAIHRLTPVVLVAQEFPKPSQIDEDWIVAHDWILRRVILDDSFIPALNYVTSKVVGDEFALQEMYKNLEQQRRLANEIKEELVAIRAQVGQRYAALQKSIEQRVEAINEDENSGGIIPMPVGFLTTSSDNTPEAARVREDAARDAYEREAKLEKEMQARLERETTALNAITETYTKNLSDHLNRKAQIARLRVHLKSNIMYYMQAIWSQEPPDQRFFRLQEVTVPKLSGTTTYSFEADPDAVPMPPEWKKPYKLVAKCKLDANLEYQTLEEVADLDNLLGFKGNYMMFPLKKSNALTDFLTTPYFDAIEGLRDPDPLGGWTISDFVKYVCCLRHTLSKEAFEKRLPGLMEAYRLLINRPGSEGDEIIVPTGSLYIEALPGVHPILEDFKLFHRVVDVKKVQAELRGIEFENLRAAARLLAGEREDPTIEKKIVIEGGTDVIVSPADN